MRLTIVPVLCVAFAIRISGQTPTTYVTDIGNGTPPILTVHFNCLINASANSDARFPET
jgi:hypothetical protein